jgi:predicted TIM-barrel fold metal-dependent hydrolase
MKKNRRDFLKHAGIAGLSVAGAGLLPSCSSGVENKAISLENQKNWRSDPEWRKVKYGAWSGPGVPDGPGPMDDVLLKDYAPKSTLITQETFIPKAKFPVIDVHVHHYPDRAEDKSPEEALADWVKTQDETGVEKSVVLTVATGDEFDKLAEMYLGKYPDRFQLFCGIESSDIDQPDYPERAVAELERCYKMGARGVGEVTDKGYGITRDRDLAPNERLHYDDARLDPFWNKCAELNIPVNIHIADHPSSWQPPDVFQERTPIFQQFNQYGEEGLSHEELVAILPRTLKRHPNTTFIACHLANLGHDLQRLDQTMAQYPNLYLDISARDYELGRQPRSAAKFLAKYADRVLFGTDMGMDKGMYQNWWRLLESADEHMVGRVWWRYYGLDLPESLLESLYRGNAEKVLNWKKV